MNVLAILISPSEAGPCAAFAKALGASGFDAIQLAGETVTKGPAKVYTAPSVSADALATAISEVAKNYDAVIAVSSSAAKDLLPRLAENLDAAMVSDVHDVAGPRTFRRQILAGSMIATVEVDEGPVVLTFRPSNFKPDSLAPTGSHEALEVPQGQVQISASTSTGSARPDIGQAKVVVSGGRPLKDAATFEKLIGGLADQLGGAVGATRAAVDSGIAPSELQVGQTGKVVAPNLYIAAGISGSTQHLAGIKDSKLIVAINTDADAPIFQQADFGLVADLYQAIPELMSKLPPR